MVLTSPCFKTAGHNAIADTLLGKIVEEVSSFLKPLLGGSKRGILDSLGLNQIGQSLANLFKPHIDSLKTVSKRCFVTRIFLQWDFHVFIRNTHGQELNASPTNLVFAQELSRWNLIRGICFSENKHTTADYKRKTC